MMTYKVTRYGMAQISDWMVEHYADEVWDLLSTPDDIVTHVYAWAKRAERSADGEIVLPAAFSNTGQIAYLRPDRIAALVEA